MADVKISDLTPATSANGAMQIEVNDGGTSKSLTLQKALASSFEQVGSTQNLSGQNTITFSSIPSHSELLISFDSAAAPDPSGNTDYAYSSLDIGYSADGSTFYEGVGVGVELETLPASYDIFMDEKAILANALRLTFILPRLTNANVRYVPFNSSQPGLPAFASSGVCYFPGTITHLRITSRWFNSSDVGSAWNMSGGTVKLYKR